MQQYLYIDTSDKDNDTLQVVCNGMPGLALLGRAPHGHLLVKNLRTGVKTILSFDQVTLPDGTSFTQEELQFAFQEKLIQVTGMCVLEHEYANIPGVVGDLMRRTVKSARGGEK